MHKEEVYHFVEYDISVPWAVVSELLFDPRDFGINLVHVSIYQLFSNKPVKRLVYSSKEWVLWCSHLLVVSRNMDVSEVKIENLGERPHAKVFA